MNGIGFLIGVAHGMTSKFYKLKSSFVNSDICSNYLFYNNECRIVIFKLSFKV